MKRQNHLIWMLGLCTLILFSACGSGSDDPEPEPPTPTPTPTPTPDPEMNVSQTSFSFSAEGGSNTFNVSGNVGWTIQSSADWCSVSPTSGEQSASVTIKVSANMDTAPRNCTITVKSLTGNLTKEITVTQEAHVFTLNVTTTELNFEATASVEHIAIEGDDPFEAISSEPDWCSIQAATDGLQGFDVNILENETGAVRTATITITGKNTGKNFDISVTQKAKSVIERADYDPDAPLPNKSNN